MPHIRVLRPGGKLLLSGFSLLLGLSGGAWAQQAPDAPAVQGAAPELAPPSYAFRPEIDVTGKISTDPDLNILAKVIVGILSMYYDQTHETFHLDKDDDEEDLRPVAMISAPGFTPTGGCAALGNGAVCAGFNRLTGQSELCQIGFERLFLTNPRQMTLTRFSAPFNLSQGSILKSDHGGSFAIASKSSGLVGVHWAPMPPGEFETFDLAGTNSDLFAAPQGFYALKRNPNKIVLFPKTWGPPAETPLSFVPNAGVYYKDGTVLASELGKPFVHRLAPLTLNETELISVAGPVNGIDTLPSGELLLSVVRNTVGIRDLPTGAGATYPIPGNRSLEDIQVRIHLGLLALIMDLIDVGGVRKVVELGIDGVARHPVVSKIKKYPLDYKPADSQ